MQKPYKLKKHLCRFATVLPLYSAEIPEALFYAEAKKPNLEDFPYPLPSLLSDYTCEAVDSNGVRYCGAKTGLTRIDLSAEMDSYRVMYFSADRYLPDNNVRSIYIDEDGVIWVLCKTGASKIEMKNISCEEKAALLYRETRTAVDRRGMATQKVLTEARNIDSYVSYGHSDNDGCFTAAFSIGEILHYACMKRQYGEADSRTVNAKAGALRASEACLLLMNISGRGNGFVARTYLAPDEPVPNESLFFEKQADGTAVCLDTAGAQERKTVGMRVSCATPVPTRLSKLYRSLDIEDVGIRYKGDTSSDEITLHFLNLLYTYDFLCEEDEELKELVISSCKNTMNHIIQNGFTLVECDGKPTTWARWDPEYFQTELGWADACLNSVELLMYLKVTMHITGEKGKWQRVYDEMIQKHGYADLPLLHLDRFTHYSYAQGNDCSEEMMYGDNMLAVCAFFGLITLEDDPDLKEKYRKALRTWDHSLLRENNPGYRFPCKLACPDYPIDMEKIASWFYHNNPSRLSASIEMKRVDLPRRKMYGGGLETGWLLEPDELPIERYDYNFSEYHTSPRGSLYEVDTCYVYTFAYWFGRYYGFIEEGEMDNDE